MMTVYPHVVSASPRFGANIRLETLQGSQTLVHQTELFREMDTLARLPKFLNKRFPDGVPVEIYAGSNGADALSMGILMLGMLGKDRARKYPVITSDLMPDLLERSKTGIVGLLPDKAGGNPWQDLERRWEAMRTRVIREEGVDPGALADYLETRPIAEELYPEFRLKHSRHPRYNSQGNWWTSSAEYEQLHHLRPGIKAQLDRQLIFSPKPVDVVQALVHDAVPPEKPRVIFLRNMIYMLSMPDMRALARSLGETKAKGSVLVMGATEGSPHLYDRDLFFRLLKEGGWQPHKDIANVWVKS